LITLYFQNLDAIHISTLINPKAGGTTYR